MKRLNTIRFQLTIWNSIVVIVVTLLSLFLARQAMVYTLEYETRELLKEEITEMELAVKKLYPNKQQIADEFDRKILSHARNRWFAQLVESPGQVVWESKAFPESFDEDQPDKIGAFTFRQHDDSIACWHSLKVESGASFTIILGEPIDFISRDLWSLTKVLLWIGFAVTVIAPVGGYLLARKSMMPVQEIVETTQKLSPSKLDERLPIRGTGDELDQISDEINSFLDSNKKYLTSQREFIANAAHELRSPLTAIQTSAEVCLSKDRSVDEYRDQLETVSEQCQFLRHLVNQLLELAETDAGFKINKTELDLAELVVTSIAIFQGVAEEKQLQIHDNLDPNCLINGDRDKIRQVVNNLLDNAIKYASTDTTIYVELTCDSDDASLRITNQCDRPLADETLNRLFDRFYQAKQSRNRDESPGNGLGLSICRSIVEAHKGSIDAMQSGREFSVQVEIPRH